MAFNRASAASLRFLTVAGSSKAMPINKMINDHFSTFFFWIQVEETKLD
jgi:hypothetical protein